jgi:hypothetical protein
MEVSTTMANVKIRECTLCRTLFSGTKGFEFVGEPLANLGRLKEKLKSEGHRVTVVQYERHHKDCPNCIRSSRMKSNGGSFKPKPSRHIPDDDANGGWSNVVRSLEG